MGMFAPMTWSPRPGRWLVITAFIELVLAAGFLVVGLSNPLLRGGFLLTAAILGGVGLLLLLWGRRMMGAYREAQRIRTQGVPGQATILGMRQTGAYMNQQPQIELRLQVQTEMQGPYEVTLKEWVPLMLLGTLTGGQPLPVKVDPADPQRVIIEWESAGGTGAAAAPGSGPAYDAVKQRLLASGVDGTATVVSSTPTGQTDAQGRPVYDMVLTVRIDGRPEITAPARVGVPPERAEQLEVGESVPVKADAANPSLMAVDWDNA